jgi:ABC-type Mn2+/Zn2+ transport system permease subunit
MGLDWLFFSNEAATLGLALPFTMTVGFLTGSIGTYHLQRKYALDTRPVAWLKGLVAGILVGIPFPLAGTLAGAWIVANSGLASLKNRLLKERLFRRS